MVVHLDGGAANLGSFPTAADGSFRISGVAADSAVRVIAEYSIDCVFRTGFVDAHTPAMADRFPTSWSSCRNRPSR